MKTYRMQYCGWMGAAFALVALPAWGATLCVNPGGSGGCFSSIQAAIDAANPNDEIVIAPGTYPGLLSINKPLTLRGQNPANRPQIVVPVGATNIHVPGILLNASNIVLQDLWVYQADFPADSAILAIPRGGTWPNLTIQHSNIVLRNSRFQGGRRALFATVNNITIEGCRFDSQARDSLFFNAVSGNTVIRHNLFDTPSDKSILFENFSSGDPTCSGTIKVEYNYSNRRVNFFVWNQWLGNNTPRINLQIRHNTCSGQNSAAIAFWAGTVQDPNAFQRFSNILIIDNLVNNGGGSPVFVSYQDYGLPMDNNLKPVPANGQIKVSHTLSFNNAPSGMTDGLGTAGYDDSFNAAPGASLAMFAITNTLTSNPQYVDPVHVNGNFSLKPNSPARCAASDGTTIGAWQDPICRLSRRCACKIVPQPGDDDDDGVPNDNEFNPDIVHPFAGSNRYLWDSDGDGLADGYEDANADGVKNVNETDTRKRDTDGDGVWDGIEAIYLLTDPLNAADPVTVVDVDGDGLPAGLDANDTKADTDGDKFSDGIEAVMCGLGSVTNAVVKPPFGDVNCDTHTSNLDSLIISSIFLQVTPHNVVGGESNGDVNRDGFATNLDSLVIQQWFIGVVTPYLPVPLF